MCFLHIPFLILWLLNNSRELIVSLELNSHMVRVEFSYGERRKEFSVNSAKSKEFWIYHNSSVFG